MAAKNRKILEIFNKYIFVTILAINPNEISVPICLDMETVI